MSKFRPGPFSVGVRDIEHRPGEMREKSFDVTIRERWGEGLVTIPANSPIAIDVRLESVHEGILVTGDAEATYEGECGRCLTEIAERVEVEFQELFAYPGSEANDFEVQDDHVDLETLVRDGLVLALPFQPVCRPDCPGLDPETGRRLADGETSTAPADPRWAALAGLSSELESTEDIPSDHDGAPRA
ncbi:DUF177 domain-containing protein [uncultured Microbacterium sp.]|jgi:uncharacterized protein|uniref:YceD family protein n=1 Tax=uncultured Microbacterium sp. TaxID=191216 RepID=UPI0025F7E72E|nr:DUF177 domain-containing protein [uncultured Microbacterium sp.]